MILQANQCNSYELLGEFGETHRRLMEGSEDVLKEYSAVFPGRSVEQGYDCLLFIGRRDCPTDLLIRVLEKDF